MKQALSCVVYTVIQIATCSMNSVVATDSAYQGSFAVTVFYSVRTRATKKNVAQVSSTDSYCVYTKELSSI